MYKKFLIIFFLILILVYMFYPNNSNTLNSSNNIFQLEKFSLNDISPLSKCMPTPCVNGKNVDNKCVCTTGWQGVLCDTQIQPSTSDYTLKLSLKGAFENLDSDFNYYRSKDGDPPDRIDDSKQIVSCVEPTHGQVCYGKWDDLIIKNGNQLKLLIADKAEKNGKKRSIRLESKKTFNGGLFVIDVKHIPDELGVWPAIWLTGSEGTWPANGEIDIIEGVNKSLINASTLHTKPGCVQTTTKKSDCGAGGGYEGCSIDGPADSFGSSFNNNGGGVFVCEWIFNGTIKVWFFKGDEYSLLSGDKLNPSTWKLPYATFSACPNYFNKLKLVINTTLCGDWAGATYPGGVNKCNDDVKNNPLPESYWLINSINVYQK